MRDLQSPSVAARPRIVLPLVLGLMLSAAAHSGSAACVGDCDGNGEATVDELIMMVNIGVGEAAVDDCRAGDSNGDGDVTVNEIVEAVNNALSGCPFMGTPTPTATPTMASSPTVTPTLGELGLRHFVINQTHSPFQAALAPGLTITLAGFQGQTDGEVGPAFFDFMAGQPDPVTGLAAIDIVDSSEFIFADASGLAGLVLCLKPVLPVTSAGLIACDGGFPFGFATSQDHHVGQVGVDDFTPEDCDAANGHLEGPNQICKTGLIGALCRKNAECDTEADAGDGVCGLSMARCSAGLSGDCQADADCDTDPMLEDGICGSRGPHPGVCNGPLIADALPGDSGVGAVVIAPIEVAPDLQLKGLPVRLSIQSSLPCVDPGPGATMGFALTSGEATSTVTNFSNNLDQTLSFTGHGENFSCPDWQNPMSPGRLTLSAPAIDQNPGGGDVITGFTFSGQ